MPFALFELIVNRCLEDRPNLDYCTVSGFGEALLDPGWQEKLAFARQRFRTVHVVTTLGTVEHGQLADLAELASEVRVSMGGVDDATYAAVHRPQTPVSFREIETRVLSLLALRKSGLRVILTCCAVSPMQPVLGQWIDRWKHLADEVEVWRPHNWVNGRAYRTPSPTRMTSCGRPEAGPIQVQVDGTVNVCCFDFNGDTEIGDLRVKRLAEILDGQAMRRFRTLHAKGQADSLPTCRVCDQRDPPERKQEHLLFSSRDKLLRVQQTSSGHEVMGLDSRGAEPPVGQFH
jgi:hypothetical protein